MRGSSSDGVAASLPGLSDEDETGPADAVRRWSRPPGPDQRVPVRSPGQRRLPGDLRVGRRSRTVIARAGAGPQPRVATRAPLRRAPEPETRGETVDSPRPYLRDDLLDLGVLVETLETAARAAAGPTSPAVHQRHRRRRWSIDSSAPMDTSVLVGCHVSHLYPTGASLYFTVLAPAAVRIGRAVGQGQAGRDGRAAVGAGAHADPPSRGRRRPRRLAGRRDRSGRYRGAAGGQGAPRPRRHPEPRQTDAVKLALVVNPSAGGGRGEKLLPGVREALSRHDPSLTCERTRASTTPWN